MRTLLVLLAVAVVGLLWLRHENGAQRARLESARLVASEQQAETERLTRRLAAVTLRAEKNERAQAELRQKLSAAGERQAQREQIIKRLLNNDENFRQWYGAALPDAVRRVHRRAACASAGSCLQPLPEGEPLPDAGQPAGNERRSERRY